MRGPQMRCGRATMLTVAGRKRDGDQQMAEPQARSSWQWGRTAQTQRALLDAAREVFTRQGFAEASIADVVERAGSSVGSLYHHFGGKSELFLALWQEHQAAYDTAASNAVAAARRAGVSDPAMLFSTGDGPPGFELMRRHRGHEWIRQNDALLRLADTSLDRLYAAVLTSVIGEGGREVAAARTRAQADEIIDAVIEYARRLMTGGPARSRESPS